MNPVTARVANAQPSTVAVQLPAVQAQPQGGGSVDAPVASLPEADDWDD